MSADRLSYSQHGIWITERAGCAGTAYHMATSLWLAGELDVPSLLRACAAVVARHGVLGMIVWTEDGTPRLAPASAPVPVHRVAYRDTLVREEMLRRHRPLFVREGPLNPKESMSPAEPMDSDAAVRPDAAQPGAATAPEAVRRRVAELVESASDGAVPADEALAPDASLTALGLGSLGFLRLLDAVESAYGVEVDAGRDRLDTVDQLVDRVCGHDRRPAE